MPAACHLGAERIQAFRRLTGGHNLSGVYWTVEGGKKSWKMGTGEETVCCHVEDC